MIPLWAQVQWQHQTGRRWSIWFPLLLVWILLLPFAIVLFPFFVIGCWVCGLGAFQTLSILGGILSALKGTEVDIKEAHTTFLIVIR